MTARSIRRAAERKAQKLARKAAQISNSQSATSPEPAHAISEAQLAANQKNAQLSTGPASVEGKAKSSLNAVRTALTGRTVLLPTDDAAAYQHHVQQFELEYQPSGLRESALVQSIADTFWRLDRIRSLEWAIFARGRTQFAEQFAHEDPSSRPALIDLETFLAYEKQLRNLQIQEARLYRRYEKDSTELRRLQQERKSREIEAAQHAHEAARLRTGTKRENPSLDGFVFSTGALEAHLAAPPAPKTPQRDPDSAPGDPAFAASAA